MKAKQLKTGMTYVKSIMYWFDCTMDIIVEEPQDKSECDKVILHFIMEKGEIGYFSKEYLPPEMPKEGVKKPDITAVLERTEEKKSKWYIYELKDDIAYAKTALKLCSQWYSGIEHLKSQYLNHLAGYNIDNSLGIILRHWNREKLQKEKDYYENRIKQESQLKLLTAKKSQTVLNKYRQKVKAIQFILDGVFVFYNDMGEKETYPINYIYMTETAPGVYSTEINVIF